MTKYSKRDPGEQFNERPHVMARYGGYDNPDECIVRNPPTDCPACGYPSYCPCPNCFRHIPAGMFPHYSVGDFWKCGNCGFSEHVDWRLEREMDAYKAKGGE